MTVIVVLAMIFALLALRLFSVLGRRTGHEQRQLPTPVDDRTVAARAPASAQGEGNTPGQRAAESVVAVPAQSGLRALIAADRGFDVGQFMTGARAAYGLILDAFWKGDRETLAHYCDADVKDAFESAIAAREAAGHTLDNKLVRIESANIVDVSVANGYALVAVRFEADLSAVTRNAEGEVVAGSLDDAIGTVETWTFGRDLRSRDPNWQLVETDEG
ncbi:MAG: preprotein translocase subunit Tim44 [Sphingobium sp. 66-54]|nr:MAG: preprotein translocase subunit Tim44 [Sphingobium sp. 66-54]